MRRQANESVQKLPPSLNSRHSHVCGKVLERGNIFDRAGSQIRLPSESILRRNVSRPIPQEHTLAQIPDLLQRPV
jgi:hypothetical protein